jgi:tetratricopeptide (TPR) repeat protein
LFTLLSLDISSGRTYREPHPEFTSLIDSLIEKTIVHNYAMAESLAMEMIKRAPDAPEGYFYRAVVVNLEMIDYEDRYRDKDFFTDIDKTIDLAKEAIKREPDNPWFQFYLGAAEAYQSFQHLRDSNYFSSLTEGLRAIGKLNRVLEMDSTLYDVYLGIGNYKYWVSRRTEFLQWLPLISDQREEGIRILYLALNKSKYSHYMAVSSLSNIFIDAGRYDEALAVIKEPLQKFPQSRFYIFPQARCLFELGQYEEAILWYQELLVSVRNAPRNNHYNEIGILAKLAEALVKLKRYELAESWCQEGLSLRITEKVKKRAKKPLEKLEECQRICQKR